MADILHATAYPYPTVRAASRLLASHTDHVERTRRTAETRDLLGHHRHDHMLLPQRADVGHQQHHRKREVRLCQSQKVGGPEVGLGSRWTKRHANPMGVFSMDLDADTQT
jgi:hypothetical protein